MTGFWLIVLAGYALAAIALTIVIIYAILTTETTGTWFAMGAVTNHKITSRQWNHGIIGEGLSCLVAALAGTTPVTGYSTNAGVISITLMPEAQPGRWLKSLRIRFSLVERAGSASSYLDTTNWLRPEPC